MIRVSPHCRRGIGLSRSEKVLRRFNKSEKHVFARTKTFSDLIQPGSTWLWSVATPLFSNEKPSRRRIQQKVAQLLVTMTKVFGKDLLVLSSDIIRRLYQETRRGVFRQSDNSFRRVCLKFIETIQNRLGKPIRILLYWLFVTL